MGKQTEPAFLQVLTCVAHHVTEGQACHGLNTGDDGCLHLPLLESLHSRKDRTRRDRQVDHDVTLKLSLRSSLSTAD